MSAFIGSGRVLETIVSDGDRRHQELGRNRLHEKGGSAGSFSALANFPAKHQIFLPLPTHIQNRLAGSDNWVETAVKSSGGSF